MRSNYLIMPPLQLWVDSKLFKCLVFNINYTSTAYALLFAYRIYETPPVVSIGSHGSAIYLI